MAMQHFETQITQINRSHILHFPVEASEKLPSRGMVMVVGTINGIPVEMALEPDGKGSHWFLVSESLFSALQEKQVKVAFEILESWHEPDVPNDLYAALEASDLVGTWLSLTTKARWEWVRWVRFTNNPDTRKKRIEVTCSKLDAGKRRPCCFDLTRSTDTSVSKNGVLLD